MFALLLRGEGTKINLPLANYLDEKGKIKKSVMKLKDEMLAKMEGWGVQ